MRNDQEPHYPLDRHVRRESVADVPLDECLFEAGYVRAPAFTAPSPARLPALQGGPATTQG